MIQLKKYVEDIITGYHGTVVSRSQYISGEDLYGVQAPVTKDGELPAVKYFDESRLIEKTK